MTIWSQVMSLSLSSGKSSPITSYQKNLGEEHFETGKSVVLQPVAMRFPNRHNIYSPSKLRPKRQISYEEFLTRYADYPRKILVCFDESPCSTVTLERSELITAYGFGWDCWYVVEAYTSEPSSDQS
jgi:hypothetical protein